MALIPSFPSVPANDPAKRGELATPKQTFGESGRYAVAPMHTRFGAIEWLVWDAEDQPLGESIVIRQSQTLEQALEGLI